MSFINKYILYIAILFLCLCAGFSFTMVYQPMQKSIEIYRQALKDYNNENYSNSYYLFSKIGRLSALKSAALYRQALCAQKLGDKKSQINSYLKLVRYFPKDKLSPEAKYNAGILLLNSNPKKAEKFFNDIIKSDLNSDYKLASNYLKSKIEVKKENIITKDNENAFRDYLKKAPSGRFALDCAKTWQKYSNNLSNDDLLLISKAYYSTGQYKDSLAIASKINVKDSWAIQVLNYSKMSDYSNVRYLTELGVSKYSQNISTDDFKDAITQYLKTQNSYYGALTNLLNISKGKNKDYIWNLKCKYCPKSEKYSCYLELNKFYPQNKEGIKHLIIYSILNDNYPLAKQLSDDFIIQNPEDKDIDMVMFWRAKIEQKYVRNPDYENFYKNIINNYPDSYYAYRSFWIIQRLKSAVSSIELQDKPIEYPYKTPYKGSSLYNLLLIEDYDLVEKYTDDKFIKSWILYKKGDYSSSSHTAWLAMKELKDKPPKNDPRWRLVYPLVYYKQISSKANYYKNDPALMISIAREESRFNPSAQSSVGAIGLMQLMPSTAHDIASKVGRSFDTSDLFNPELNIEIGNLYYSTLRKLSDNMDISAIASYNGGLGSVKNWKSALTYKDSDEFVEQIPYEETKDYVKKVFASYWNYIRIYQ